MDVMDTYDEVFATYLKLELEKINPIMRFTKKKGVIFLWIIGALAFITYVLLAFLTDSVKTTTVTVNTVTGGEYGSMPVAYYSTTVCVLLIITALLLVFFAGWFVMGEVYERKAFRTATKKAQADWNTKKMRDNEAWQREKLRRDIY